MPNKHTDVQASRHSTTPPEPWQTWGGVTRYLIYRLAQATPTALLLRNNICPALMAMALFRLVACAPCLASAGRGRP